MRFDRYSDNICTLYWERVVHGVVKHLRWIQRSMW